MAAQLLLVLTLSSAAIAPGVVVESAQRGFVAERGGIRAGDVLVGWSTEAGDRHGDLVSPLLMTDLEYGELPRGPIVLAGTRAGAPLRVAVDADAVGLGLDLRPRFPPVLLRLYQRGRSAIDRGRVQEGTAIWRDAAARARAAQGGRQAGCWLLGKTGDAWAVARDAERAHEAYDDATSCAEEGDPREVATILQWQAGQAFELGQPQVTMAALETAFGLFDSHPDSPPLSVMQSLFEMVGIEPRREVVRHVLLPYILEVAERDAPDSLLVARALLNLGHLQLLDAEMETAEITLTRGAAIAERAGPWSSTWARVQTVLGELAGTRGDLARLEEHFRRAAEQLVRLQPESLDTARALVNVGAAADARGDADSAARWGQAALRVLEKHTLGRRIRAVALNNLGHAALMQGEPDRAVRAFTRALADMSATSPSSRNISTIESNLADAHLARGEVSTARHHADRALEQAERVAPRTTTMVEALEMRGDVARREGDWDVASDCYEWALEVLADLRSDGIHVGRAHEGMASVARHRGDVQAAERHLRAAIAIYESKHGVGQSDEERSLFQSSFHGVYRALIELLLEQGRIEEGFEVLEASRARSLRAMLAARDLQFELDVPPEKERERRSVASEYERARQDLARAPDSQSAAAREGLEALRERLVALEAEIDRWAPRLAALREPEAMTSRDVASRLGPGTLVVAYSVGSERTAVFALAADGGLVAHLLPVGEDALRARIARWRRLAKAAEAGPRFRAEARALHELLLEPLGDRLQRAKRIVVSADGPLHGLPFAALRDARGYLVESTALVFAPSGTFYAQQGAEDGPKGWSAPAAFADPSSPSFARLPGSRREVASVAAVFPDIRSYLGPDATKDNVRSLPRTGRFVHFAVHGVANFRAPLESALVLAGDTAGREADDGLLHAWEVFERVRVDADLVTLSACDSGAGAERPGEGLIGLTRAFLYAGARSVVASLWSVGDGPAAPFMRAFYQEWAGGQSKAEALRRAQMDAIRRGQRPLRWAAFQLHGQDR